MLSHSVHFRYPVIALLLIGGVLAACGRTIVYSEQPPVTPANTIAQNAAVIAHPLANTLKNCAVISDTANNNASWVYFKDDPVWFINIIERDSQGRMWLATDGRGLTMFNGYGWRNWQSDTGTDMLSDAIRTIAITQKTVYAGAYGSSAGGDILTYGIEQDKWGAFQAKDMRGKVIGGMAVTQDDQVYFMVETSEADFVTTTVTSGEIYTPTNRPPLLLDIYSNGNWQYIKPPPTEFNFPLIQDGLLDKQGNYWLATGQFTGVWKYDGKKWTTFSAEQKQLPSNHVTALATDSVGRIWATTTHGLAVYDVDGQWYVFSPEKYPWFAGWLSGVAIDSQDRAWVISNDRLMVFNGKEIALFTPDEVGTKLWGNAIGFDADGCVWVGTMLGLAILRNELNMNTGVYTFK